jgi:hypothetical protein
VTIVELDAFDLPDWLGEARVAWAPEDGLDGHLVRGALTGTSDRQLPCDLLAVDQAYPAPVLDEALRTRVHQSWQHGQVLLLDIEGRASVATPGISWTADTVLEALTRLARSVGADPASWSALLALGSRGR